MSGNECFQFRKSNSPSQPRVAIIGAGAAGLFAALFLRRIGAQVSLFEAHSLPGGCASWFARQTPFGAATFDVGATVVSDLHEGAPLRAALLNHGVEAPSVHRMQRMHYILANRHFTLETQNSQQWIRSLEKAFPQDRCVQTLFPTLAHQAEALHQTLFKVPHLPLEHWRDFQRNLRAWRSSLPLLPAFLDGLGTNFETLLQQHEASPELRQWVNMNLLITLQAQAHEVHPLWAAMALFFYPLGAGSLMGGMKSLFLPILKSLRESSLCQVAFNSPVAAIETQGSLLSLRTADFKNLGTFDAVFSSIPRFNTALLAPQLRLFSQEATWDSLAPSLWGAVTGYWLVRDQERFSAHPFHAHLSQSPGDEVYFSFSARHHRAPDGCRAVTLSTHSKLAQWSKQNDYQAQKQEIGQKLRQQGDRSFPELEILYEEYGTPCTFAHYTRRYAGSVGGLPLNIEHTGLNAPSQRTRHPRIFQMGDTAFPGQSLLACALGAAAAVEKYSCVNPSSIFG